MKYKLIRRTEEENGAWRLEFNPVEGNGLPYLTIPMTPIEASGYEVGDLYIMDLTPEAE